MVSIPPFKTLYKVIFFIFIRRILHIQRVTSVASQIYFIVTLINLYNTGIPFLSLWVFWNTCRVGMLRTMSPIRYFQLCAGNVNHCSSTLSQVRNTVISDNCSQLALRNQFMKRLGGHFHFKRAFVSVRESIYLLLLTAFDSCYVWFIAEFKLK